MTKSFSLILILSLAITVQLSAQQVFERSSPAESGFNAQKLDSLATYLEGAGSSSMIILVDGKIAFEWGETSRAHTIHSIRKAMLNSLYGIKVHEGLIDTNTTLGELGIDDKYPLSEQEKSARIADVLKSRSGVYHPAAAVSQGMLRGMPERESYKPDEHYYYNNWDFNVLGAILEQETGESLYTTFLKEIAIPLGMKDFKGSYTDIRLGEYDEDVGFPDTDGFYQYEKRQSNYPAYHFRMSARDMALYGQLYLQKGNWEGTQIIPESWIEASTRGWSVTNQERGFGYGMLWYVLLPTETRATKSFYHTGTGVHMMGVYPASKLVLIHRVDTEKEYDFNQGNFYGMINRVWGARE
ncbi:MAG: serine hydrolase [Balneolaceae bacterium]